MSAPRQDVRNAAAELVERSAVARGLPAVIDDDQVLGQIATLVDVEPEPRAVNDATAA